MCEIKSRKPGDSIAVLFLVIYLWFYLELPAMPFFIIMAIGMIINLLHEHAIRKKAEKVSRAVKLFTEKLRK